MTAHPLPGRRGLLALLTLLAVHGGPALGATPLDSLAAELAESAELPALAAQFRVTLSTPGSAPRQQTWQLTRDTALITWRKGPGTEEIWRRDRSGISLERVLRADRHVIRYSAGELRALQVAVDWLALATLFAPTQRAALQAQPVAPGQTAEHWSGRIGAEQVDLLWDPVAHLPLRLRRTSRDGQVLFERITLQASAPADWPRVEAGLDDFQRLDAADFGDMAYNPVVRRAQAEDERAGWRPRHRH